MNYKSRAIEMFRNATVGPLRAEDADKCEMLTRLVRALANDDAAMAHAALLLEEGEEAVIQEAIFGKMSSAELH